MRRPPLARCGILLCVEHVVCCLAPCAAAERVQYSMSALGPAPVTSNSNPLPCLRCATSQIAALPADRCVCATTLRQCRSAISGVHRWPCAAQHGRLTAEQPSLCIAAQRSHSSFTAAGIARLLQPHGTNRGAALYGGTAAGTGRHEQRLDEMLRQMRSCHNRHTQPSSGHLHLTPCASGS